MWSQHLRMHQNQIMWFERGEHAEYQGRGYFLSVSDFHLKNKNKKSLQKSMDLSLKLEPERVPVNVQ